MPVIPIWNKCNSNCVMCTNPSQFKEDALDFSYKNIKERLLRHKKSKKEFIGDTSDDKFYLTGGEPTLNPDLIKIIKEIGIQFPERKVSLLTNGRTFVYEDYVKKIMKINNLSELIIPIHGHNGEYHDSITRARGSFKQTFLGISNVFKNLRPGLSIEIRVVISKYNYKDLDKTISLISKYFYKVNSVPIIFMEFEGQAELNHSFVGVKYYELKKYFYKLEKFIDDFPDLRFYHFPLCTIPTKFWPMVWRTLPDYEVTFDDKCDDCYYKKECLGIHKHYKELIGTKEFKPIKNKVKLKKSGNYFKPFSATK